MPPTRNRSIPSSYSAASHKKAGRLRLAGVGLLVLLAVALLALSGGSSQLVSTVIPVQAGQLQAVRLHEPLEAELSYPSGLLAGQPAAVRLVISPSDAPGQVSAALPDVNEAYNPLLETRLDLPGFSISPGGNMAEPLRPGQAAVFVWQVTPQTAGTYRGDLWIYLDLVPRAGGDAQQVVLLVPQIRVDVYTILGLNVRMLRGAAVVCLAAALLLGLLPLLVKRK